MNRTQIDKMKPSAYKSARLAKLNNTKETGGLRDWFDEKWRNLTPKLLGDNNFYDCGSQSKEQRAQGLPSVCRPTVRVNSKTTTPMAQQITRKQLKKAVDLKKQGNRINWSKLD